MKATLASTLLLFSSAAPAAIAGENWHPDLDAALAVAKEQKKDLLVDFTGSDWCGWCTRLDREVFSHEEFLSVAQKSFVLVALDFPQKEEAKAKVPNPKRNAELAEKHGIQGFPTVLLMNSDGEVFASTGYRAGGPESYLTHLEEISTSGRKALVEVKALVGAFDAAQGDAKLAELEKVLTRLEGLEDGSPFATLLAVPARQALSLDAENARGLKLRAIKALFTAGKFDDDLVAAARALDPKNELGLLERVVDHGFRKVEDDETARAALLQLDALLPGGFRDKELGFRLCFLAARWCAGPLEDAELAKKYARAAKEIGTEEAGILEMLDEMIGE